MYISRVVWKQEKEMQIAWTCTRIPESVTYVNTVFYRWVAEQTVTSTHDFLHPTGITAHWTEHAELHTSTGYYLAHLNFQKAVWIP